MSRGKKQVSCEPLPDRRRQFAHGVCVVGRVTPRNDSTESVPIEGRQFDPGIVLEMNEGIVAFSLSPEFAGTVPRVLDRSHPRRGKRLRMLRRLASIHGAICQPIEFVKLDGMLPPPVAQRQQHWLEAQTKRRRTVVDARRNLAEHFTMYQAMLLHLAQLLDQNFLADVLHLPHQIGEALRPIEKTIQDDRLPTPGDHLERTLHR